MRLTSVSEHVKAKDGWVRVSASTVAEWREAAVRPQAAAPPDGRSAAREVEPAGDGGSDAARAKAAAAARGVLGDVVVRRRWSVSSAQPWRLAADKDGPHWRCVRAALRRAEGRARGSSILVATQTGGLNWK